MIFLLVALLPFTAQARPQYFNELQGHFTNVPNRCQTCHASTGNPKALNPFGQDFFSTFFFSTDPLFREMKDKTREEKWAFLLALDSDKDGVTNTEELASGRHPGNPAK